MIETKYSVANRIKTIRQIMGLKQGTVACMLKVSQQSFCQIENSADIHTSTLYKVSQVLGIDAALIVSQHIPITADTIKEFSLENRNNAMVELMLLRQKVANYKNIIISMMNTNNMAITEPGVASELERA